MQKRFTLIMEERNFEQTFTFPSDLTFNLNSFLNQNFPEEVRPLYFGAFSHKIYVEKRTRTEFTDMPVNFTNFAFSFDGSYLFVPRKVLVEFETEESNIHIILTIKAPGKNIDLDFVLVNLTLLLYIFVLVVSTLPVFLKTNANLRSNCYVHLFYYNPTILSVEGPRFMNSFVTPDKI